MKETTKPKNRLLYAQASAPKVDEILKLKANYPSLLAKKINSIYETINNSGKVKPGINIAMKDPSGKQIIIPIGNNNKARFMASLSLQITNINSVLRNIKSDVMADFVWAEQLGIIITMNKVALPLDLQTIENYVKNVDYINFNDIKMSCLPQSKFYLKIIGISYLMKNTNTLMNSSVVETIIKNNHIFNNISLASKLQVIKISPKSDIAIIWLDIWGVQSGSKAKCLINRYFNVRSYIPTI